MPTPVTVANIFIDASWQGGGGGALVVTGTQRRCQITITAGVAPSINPFFRFTYPDGPYPLEPGILAKMVGGTGQFADVTYQPGIASTEFTYNELPVAGQTYIFDIDTLGI